MSRRGCIRKIAIPPWRTVNKTSAFVRGRDERSLRILVDADTVTGGDALQVLREFAHHDLVEVVSTDQEEGMLLLEIGAPRPDGETVPVTLNGAQGRLRTAIWAESWIGQEASRASDPEGAKRCLRLCEAAECIGADALATYDDYLLGGESAFVERANVVTPDEAVALLGLFLRLRGIFTYAMGDSYSESFDRGLLYWVTTRELLPAGWRWFSACVYNADARGDVDLIGIGQSALRRFDRVLRARDRLHEQCQLPADNNSQDEALFYLDVALLQLAGAFDAVARVARHTYALPRNPAPSWRSENWVRKLDTKAPKLASLVTPGTPVRDVIEIVSLLRNTIHEAALQGTAFHRNMSRNSRENLVRVPQRVQQRLHDAVRRRGRNAHWGVRMLPDESSLVEPDTFIEALVPAAARALNRLMATTEVERLPGLAEERLTLRAPSGRNEPFIQPIRKRLRLLAGL
jgi:hypothetical protein